MLFIPSRSVCGNSKFNIPNHPYFNSLESGGVKIRLYCSKQGCKPEFFVSHDMLSNVLFFFSSSCSKVQAMTSIQTGNIFCLDSMLGCTRSINSRVSCWLTHFLARWVNDSAGLNIDHLICAQKACLFFGSGAFSVF